MSNDGLCIYPIRIKKLHNSCDFLHFFMNEMLRFLPVFKYSSSMNCFKNNGLENNINEWILNS